MGLFFGNLYLNVLSILVSLLCAIVAYFKYCFTYWSRRGVPCNPPKFPFGNLKDVFFKRYSFGEYIQKNYSDFKSKGYRFGGFYIFSNPQIFIIDPKLLKHILCTDFSHFTNTGFSVNAEKEPITGHLLGLKGNKWKKMRRILTPTFTSGKIKMMFQIFLTCANGLERMMDDFVKNKEDIDIKDILGKFSTDVIGSCAFGLDCNSIQKEDTQFYKYAKTTVNPTKCTIYKRTLVRIFPKIFYFFNLRQIDQNITDFYTKVIADTIDYREKNNIKRNDFLQLLINIKNTGNVDENTNSSENGSVDGITLEEIVAQCFIFFLAGFETSSTAMSLFLYDMSLNQDIQDKVREGINDMLKKYDGKVTYEGIMELQYLEQTVFESLRLHSAIPVYQRCCTKDYKIPDSDVIIEKGTTLTIPLAALHSDPEYYPDPTKYDPDRFTKEKMAKMQPFTFLPFGEGPRNCIGQRFGLIEVKVGLVVLLKNHRFTLSKKTPVPLKIDPISVHVNDFGSIWMNAERI